MSLHLLKLCVGCESVEDLRNSVRRRMAEKKAAGLPQFYIHTTRMTPKRADELEDGGSLYWVIKGSIACRQKLVAVDPFIDPGGVSRCHLVLAPEVVATFWQPRRAFQGWRYLKSSEAPADLGSIREAQDIPPELQLELAGLGLL